MLRTLATAAFCLSVGIANATGLDAFTNKDVSAGLKEALNRGAEYAVTSLGKENGFLGNDKVRIPLPDSLKKVEKGLRTFGMGKQADELLETMNHAAENAVAEAKPILLDSVKKMTVQDAKGIMTGGEDSVTQYFRRTSAEALTKKFAPMGVKYGLLDAKDANLDNYVTAKAIDGLFLMIAEKEKELRANPMEAGSAMLKKIFGAL